MPDSDGKLTDQDRKLVADWIQKHNPNIDMKCPICGQKKWMLAEHMVQPATLGSSFSLQLGGGHGYPHVMLISDPCGYVMMLNAVMIGLTKK